jgi:hypothetical protein
MAPSAFLWEMGYPGSFLAPPIGLGSEILKRFSGFDKFFVGQSEACGNILGKNPVEQKQKIHTLVWVVGR